LVTWLDRKGEKVTATAARPNVECMNGIIHVIDRVFIDDAPPWTVGAAATIEPTMILTFVGLCLLFFSTL